MINFIWQKIIKRFFELVFLFIIKGYQLFISPLFSGSCRYYPTCSSYGIQAIKKHGPFKGGWLTIKRIARCHPWGGHGHDPVP